MLMETNEGNQSDGSLTPWTYAPERRIIGKAEKYTPRVSGA
jgi:hypothetical protein